VIVGFLQEAVDGGLEIDNRMEDAAFEAAVGQLSKEAFDRIEPGGRGSRGIRDGRLLSRSRSAAKSLSQARSARIRHGKDQPVERDEMFEGGDFRDAVLSPTSAAIRYHGTVRRVTRRPSAGCRRRRETKGNVQPKTFV
jgi:hypothetical protein